MPSPDSIFEAKKKFIERVTRELDQSFTDLSKTLLKVIINQFADQLERDGDQIKNTSKNLKLIATIEDIYANFSSVYLPAVASDIFSGVKKIAGYNVDYFGTFDTSTRDFQAATADIQKIIQDRLGVTKGTTGAKVQLKPGGYLDSLLQDNSIKNQLKDLSYGEVIKEAGFQSFKKSLETFITGDEEKLGIFRQFYRTYAYDIFVQVDRIESKLYATHLDLTFFIYEGQLIETSRYFCEQNAGKVFSNEEADKWKLLIGKFKTVAGKKPGTTKKIPIGPIVDDAETYDPIIDLGGIGCRHHPRYVSKEIAEGMRPEIKNAPQ